MFKRRGFKKDVRRKPIERVKAIPQQVSTREEIGRKRGVFPKQEPIFKKASSAMSVTSIPSQKGVYASRRKPASLNDVVLALIQSQQRMYVGNQNELMNKKFEDSIKAEREKNEKRISDLSSEVETLKSELSQYSSVADERMSQFIDDAVANIPIRTPLGYEMSDDLNKVTLKTKAEGIIKSVSRDDETRAQEVLDKIDSLNQRIDLYKKENERYANEIAGSMADRVKDSEAKMESQIRDVRNDIAYMIDQNRQFKASIQPVEDRVKTVISTGVQAKPQTGEKASAFIINRGEFGSDPISEKEFAELKREETKDTEEYRVYEQMVEDLRQVKQEADDLYKTMEVFAKFIDSSKRVVKLSIPTLNKLIDRLEERFTGLGLSQYKATGGKQMSEGATKEFREKVLPVLLQKLLVIKEQVDAKKAQVEQMKTGLEEYRVGFGFQKRVKI